MAGVVPTSGVAELTAACEACLKAGKKSSICWIASPGRAPRLVWASWLAGGICLVTGDGEQELPGLAGAAEVSVILRSAEAGTVVATAAPSVIRPADPEWAEVTPALAERRLNGTRTPAELVRHWAMHATLTRLTVTGPDTDTDTGS